MYLDRNIIHFGLRNNRFGNTVVRLSESLADSYVRRGATAHVVNILKYREIATGIPVDTLITAACKDEVIAEVEPELEPIGMDIVIHSHLQLDIKAAVRFTTCNCRIKCEDPHPNTWRFRIAREDLVYINKRSALRGNFTKGSENYGLLKRFIASQPFEGVFLALRWEPRLRIPELYIRVG